MPANRNALLRYRTLDRCLRNTGRRWTLDDLIDAVSDALYEYEGRQVDVSRRTVQLDLQMMRSDKLGYNAPIEVYERKYYRYADPAYAITDSPLSEQDLSRLREVVDTLRQFTGFRQMETFGGLVGRLRDQLGEGRTGGRRIIAFEHNENLRGLHWIDPLYEIIAAGHVVEVAYQSFRSRSPKTYALEPHFLKESRNRFFLLGYVVGEVQVMILALDRIHHLRDTGQTFERRPGLEPETFFEHTVGVSVTNEPPMEVVLRLSLSRAPYVITKPIHHSQRTTGRGDRYIEVTLDVQHTFELESEILGLGEDVQVVAPPRLRRRMQQLTEASAAAYEQPLTEDDFARVGERFRKTGFLHLQHFLSLRDAKQLQGSVRPLQRNPKLFREGPKAPDVQQLEITNLLSPKRAETLLSVAASLFEQLGLNRPKPTKIFLSRLQAQPDPPFAASDAGRFYVCLTRWRERHQGPECLLGKEPFGFSADYGQALLTRPGMSMRVRCQRGQVFWVVEVG